MGTYLFYLLVSGIPLIVRIIVVAWVGARENADFGWQSVLVAEQSFWFTAVLSLTTLFRLSDGVSAQDFILPRLYNVIRIALFATGIIAFAGGVLLAEALYTGGQVPRDFVFSAIIIVGALAIALGASQVGIRAGVGGKLRHV